MTKRALGIVVAGTFVLAVVLVFIIARRPSTEALPPILTASCLAIDNGPTLRLSGGVLLNSGKPVGTYAFERAVPGKYGPKISVRGVRVIANGSRIAVEPGKDDWNWPFVDNDTVKIFYYPQFSVLARRCDSSRLR